MRAPSPLRERREPPAEPDPRLELEPIERGRLRRIAEEEVVLVALLSVFAVVFLLVFPPTLLVADSWLTLSAGREIVEHGLPHHDHWTVLGAGRPWTDQQWGAQLLFYGAHSLGGLPLVVFVNALTVVGAFVLAAVAARSLGAGPASILLVFFPVILAEPGAWTVRAQVIALPLYVALLWLLASEARAPSRRVYLVFPLLLVWANLHGSVLLGTLLTMLFAVIEIARRRGVTWRQILLLVVSPFLVLVTPYGPVQTARYYHLLLVDPPFDSNQVTEWTWSKPAVDTVVFYVLAGLAIRIAVRCRRRLTAFEIAALALTLAGAVQAIRGIVWFAMACQVLLPVALGPLLEPKPNASARRANTVIAGACAVLILAAVLADVVRDRSWFLQHWPEKAVAVVRTSARDPSSRVFVTDRNADWLLWRIPALRGRIAYDVRFEIYTPRTFNRIVAFRGERTPDWKALADGYRTVVLEPNIRPSGIRKFASEPGARTLYRDKVVAVIRRAPGA